MITSIKTGRRAWAKSLAALLRSPLYILLLAAIGGGWLLAAYQWLWLPESSGWVLALALVWIVALAALALALLAGGVAGATAVASGSENHFPLSKILSLEKGRLGRTLLVMLGGVVIGAVLCWLFGWLNSHALDAASFLTFHLRHPISYVPIGKVFWIMEALAWIFFAGYVMTRLLVFTNPPGSLGPQRIVEALTRSVNLPVFYTGILTAVVFGGLAWLLATWHPVVTPGGWDYAQFVIRNGVALLLLTMGWLFWALALALLTLVPVRTPAEHPPAA